MRGRDGVDIEIVGATGGINGGAFLYTNLDTIALGVVLSMTGLARSTTRPEQIIEQLRAHHAIAPLVEGGEVVEYSAHVIPEAGVAMMPRMTGDGMLVAGDAAALCLAAGIWLEGVNFAMASGMYAGEAAAEALAAGDVSAGGLAGYERRLAATFVLQDHRRLRRAPRLVLSDRVQHLYPQLLANSVEAMFRVDNPRPKPGLRRVITAERKRLGIRRRDLAGDALDGVEDVRMRRWPWRASTPLARRWARTGGVPSLATPRSAQPFEELIGATEFRVHPDAHITVDATVCRDCSTRECVVACPANLFVPTADGGILFNYEQCFECGTCYLVCNREGAITWSYPVGGYGVVFHRS